MANLFTKSLLILLITCKGFIVLAQDTKKISLKNFKNISVSSGIDLHLNASNNESIMLNGEESVLRNVLIEQNGDNLIIKFKNNSGINFFNNLGKNRNVQAFLNFKTLEKISASGGSDVYAEKTINTNHLSISASGGSDVKINVNCNELLIASSGGSDVDLNGKATNLSIQSSGGSDVNALGLISDYAKVNSSGGSDVKLFVNKGLSASASGGSDIHYKGNAALKNESSSRSGSVKRIN